MGVLFSGWYTERRWIEAVERWNFLLSWNRDFSNSRYRDSVTVDPVESKVIRQVNYAIRWDLCFLYLSWRENEQYFISSFIHKHRRKSGKILPENSFIGLSNVDDECRLNNTHLTDLLNTQKTQAFLEPRPWGCWRGGFPCLWSLLVSHTGSLLHSRSWVQRWGWSCPALRHQRQSVLLEM